MRPEIAPPSNVFETADAANGLGTDYLLGLGNSFYGYLDDGDSDWIALKLFAGSVFNFQAIGTGTEAVSDDKLHLSLFTYNGSFVVRDDAMGDDGDGISADIWFRAEYTGIYYLKVGSKDIGHYAVLTEYSATGMPAFPGDEEVDDIADQLVNGYWENGGETLRRFDVPAGGTLEANITGLTVEGRFLAEQALLSWSAMTGMAFDFVDTGGDLVFDDDAAGAFATSSLDVDGRLITQSQINVSTDWLADSGTTVDSYGFQTYLHEIGHALGLGHAGNYNGTGTYGVDNLFVGDSWQASVMSYFSQEDNTDIEADYAYTLTPMVADMLAIQILYGRAGSLRLGDTTYGDNSTAGDFYDTIMTLKNPVTFTLLDDGGTDTIDMSSVTFDQLINLKSESFSNTMGLIGNLSIARGTVIENAIGGSGNDVLKGNSVANRLKGADGRDKLKGADGDDVLNGGRGRDSLKGGKGADTFVFKNKYGKDTIQDFENDTDSIRLDDALWSGSLSAQQVVDTFARIEGTNTILDFGRYELKIKGFTDLGDLADDLNII